MLTLLTPIVILVPVQSEAANVSRGAQAEDYETHVHVENLHPVFAERKMSGAAPCMSAPCCLRHAIMAQAPSAAASLVSKCLRIWKPEPDERLTKLEAAAVAHGAYLPDAGSLSCAQSAALLIVPSLCIWSSYHC